MLDSWTPALEDWMLGLDARTGTSRASEGRRQIYILEIWRSGFLDFSVPLFSHSPHVPTDEQSAGE
jgi:hypothetical protein